MYDHLTQAKSLHEKYNDTKLRLEQERYRKNLNEQQNPKIWEFSHVISEDFFDTVDDCTIIFNKNGQKIVLKSPVKRKEGAKTLN